MFLPLDPHLESSLQATGRALLELMAQRPSASLLTRKGVYQRLMEWAMSDPSFKIALFRFIDVLPSLSRSREVIAVMREYLGEKAIALHSTFGPALRMAGFAPGPAAAIVRWQMRDMARQFVTGESASDLLRHYRRNRREGIATTIDLLGEAVISEAEADAFLRRNLEMLDHLAAALPNERTPLPFSSLSATGPLPEINLSVKISALAPALRPEAPEISVQRLKERLFPILQRAREVGVFVNFDMESTTLKEITLALFHSILQEPEFADGPAIGIALQAYLRDSEHDLTALIAAARQQNRKIGIRLVKGAYWDMETALAGQRGWPVPVWQQKAETDACYEALSVQLLDNIDLITPAFASHNVRSVSHAIAQAEKRGIDPRAYEFQSLYGMADDLKNALLRSGYRVREYCPIGELLPGMAYLVRRLLENTSNEGFIRAKNSDNAEIEDLLANPVEKIVTAPTSSTLPSAFRNVPNSDFTHPEKRAAYDAALKALRGAIGRRCPLIIGDCEYWGAGLEPSINPAQPEQIIGHWSRATSAEAGNAIAAARAAAPAWRKTSVSSRIAILEKAATLMDERRFQLAALETLEAGKPWSEADADISEAIDFCRFYASEMQRLDAGELTQHVPGEENHLSWLPRGTGVVIAPWNFPLAILCGMAIAPIVAGNTVVLKPAEQTSLIGATFVELLMEAGLPPGVANLLTGEGEEIGPYLVTHPEIDFVAFTGSCPVGKSIWQTAAQTHPEQANLKKVICEMGGKNALIIDTSADLDEAIPAALHSAFAYAGQKCSALSRLIVVEEIYEKFVERFIAGASSLPVGDPTLAETVIGPVIDAEAQSRILAMIARGKTEATLAWQGSAPESGYYIPPTIFTNVPSDSSLAQEEIFGPVVAILKARDLSEAISLANESRYALTGGIFSRTPSSLERAKRELLVGNLYINRSITGAIVERQPFGGFRMSGGGTKAGGRDYLKEFLFPRVITENVMRRGFSPEKS